MLDGKFCILIFAFVDNKQANDNRLNKMSWLVE